MSRRAQSTVENMSADRIRRPPIVGVPAFDKCDFAGHHRGSAGPCFCVRRRKVDQRATEEEAEEERSEKGAAGAEGDVAEQVEYVAAVRQCGQPVQHLLVPSAGPLARLLSCPSRPRYSAGATGCPNFFRASTTRLTFDALGSLDQNRRRPHPPGHAAPGRPDPRAFSTQSAALGAGGRAIPQRSACGGRRSGCKCQRVQAGMVGDGLV